MTYKRARPHPCPVCGELTIRASISAPTALLCGRCRRAGRDHQRLESILDSLQTTIRILDRKVLKKAVSTAAVTGGELCQLAKHLNAEPDALTSGASSAPRVLGRLTRILREQGATNVVLPLCAACGSERPLLHPSSGGRICALCHDARRIPESCASCGTVARVHARTANGALCRNCRANDPDSWSTCMSCGRLARVYARTDAGPLCDRCYERPTERCSACGKDRPVGSRRDGVIYCQVCYVHHVQPRRPCGICGRVLTVNRRAKGEDLDRCNSCNIRPLGWCSRCQREGPITRRRSGNPLCLECVLIERVDALLATHNDPIALRLAALREVLLGGPNAATTLQWLARGGGAKLLIELSHSDALSHEVLNELPGSDRSRDYLRSLLVACGSLPAWNLDVERLNSYINELAAKLNTDEDRQLFMAFARWQVLRRFRHKQEQRQGVLSPGYSRAVVRTAARFLTTLRFDSRGMSQCHQVDIDQFVSSSVTTARYLRPFIVWSIKNQTVIGIKPSPLRHGVGSASADPMEHWALARKFLHDDSLDLADRSRVHSS